MQTKVDENGKQRGPEAMLDARRFILWSRRDGDRPRLDDDGNIDSDGVIGRVGVLNCYLTTYAEYPDARRPEHLEVGESSPQVRYSLSGSRGFYDVYRVK